MHTVFYINNIITGVCIDTPTVCDLYFCSRDQQELGALIYLYNIIHYMHMYVCIYLVKGRNRNSNVHTYINNPSATQLPPQTIYNNMIIKVQCFILLYVHTGAYNNNTGFVWS